MDSKLFKDAMSHLVTGVCMVTTMRGKSVIGITISSFTSLSLEPCLVLFTLKRNAATFDIFNDARSFSIHILAHDQHELSKSGTMRGGHQLLSESMVDGAIKGCLSSLICEKYNQVIAGDHDIFIGKVTGIKKGMKKPPLIYYCRQYNTL